MSVVGLSPAIASILHNSSYTPRHKRLIWLLCSLQSLVLQIPIALYVLYILKYQWASQVEGYVNYTSHHIGNL